MAAERHELHTAQQPLLQVLRRGLEQTLCPKDSPLNPNSDSSCEMIFIEISNFLASMYSAPQ